MNNHTTIFNQLLHFIPRDKFNTLVGQHKGDRYTKRLDTWNQFVALLYAQATGKDSLREIETGFSLNENLWYHLGVHSVARSSLARANKNRDHKIFESLFYAKLAECKNITPHRQFSFQNPLYSLDSTTIQLCLSMFDWAKYRTAKGAFKLHTLLRNETILPEFILSTNGKVGDITAAKEMNLPKRLEKGSIIVFDRAYIDFKWWKQLDDDGMFFVSRTKSNQSITKVGQHNEEKETFILADDDVLVGEYSGLFKYPKTMRRIKYYDKEKDKVYEYLTNNFDLKAMEIARIYKDRWQIELFFKWVKQNLKIKTFLGTSYNAVMTQVWIAMIYYLLLAYVKFQTRFTKSLLELTRMVKETLFVRRPLIDLLSLSTTTLSRFKPSPHPQLGLFGV
jgi:hypothetical protein